MSAPIISASEGGGGMGAGPPGDPGPVTIERVWEGQLGYAVDLSGRLLVIGAGENENSPSVGSRLGNLADSGVALDVIGDDMPEHDLEQSPGAGPPAEGTIMLGINLAPLEKIKVWRLSAFVDERISYLSRNGGGKQEMLYRVPIWDVEDSEDHVKETTTDTHRSKVKEKPKKETKMSIPLLPTPISPHRSPLVSHIHSSADTSELAGPGPYILFTAISIPNCQKKAGRPSLNFTIHHRDAGVRVEHILRVVIRIEPLDGSQDSKSKGNAEDQKKLFDITVQVPVTVLSVSSFSLNAWQMS